MARSVRTPGPCHRCGAITDHKSKSSSEFQCVPCGIAISAEIAAELHARKGPRWERYVANGRKGGRPPRNQGGG